MTPEESRVEALICKTDAVIRGAQKKIEEARRSFIRLLPSLGDLSDEEIAMVFEREGISHRRAMNLVKTSREILAKSQSSQAS